MWTPLNRADEIAQYIAKYCKLDVEWGANLILQLMSRMEDEKFRKSLHNKPTYNDWAKSE